MNNQRLLCTVMFTLFSLLSFAQQKAFNQNSSRSNHTRQAGSTTDAWQFGFNSGAAVALKSNQNTLFRGNSMATKFMSQYYFGPVGLGLNGGIISGNFSTQAIDAFITDRKFTGSTVTTSKPFNSYLLLGPSLRLGQRIQLIAEIKGGLFFNQGGSLTIAQLGAVRPLYRFESADKNLFPGFNAGLSVAYPVGTSSSIMLTGDYLHSSSSVRMYDPQQGIDVPVEQKKKMQLFTAGISFVKTFELKSPRDAASGQATGKRSHTIKTLRDASSGQASGKRSATDHDNGSIINPDKPALIKTKTKSNQSNDRTTNQSCGPVTVKTTNTDGTTDEMTFACPDDAVNYKTAINNLNNSMPNRISMNVTVPKQTQGATFGEKVNQGLHAAGSAVAQGRNLVSGKIVHTSDKNQGNGIITNAAVSTLAGGAGSGAAAASYAATGRMAGASNPTPIKGNTIHFYAREAGSGIATGRRQYQPLYFDGQTQTDVCNPCLAKVSNPIYEDKGTNGTNPLHEKSAASTDGKDDDCDGLAEGFEITLIDQSTGTAIASTKTNRCGEYWFANVPDGNYKIEVNGTSTVNKQYDVTLSTDKTDVAGEITAANEWWQHIVYNNNPVTRAGVSTSRSNIRNRQSIVITTGDTDGDAKDDFFRVTEQWNDGTSSDATERSTVSNKPAVITIPFTNNQSKAIINTSRSNIKNITVSVSDEGAIDKVTATFADGSSRDITSLVSTSTHPSVTQTTISVGDEDCDGMADLIWSPRSNVCINAKSATVNKNEIDEAVFNSVIADVVTLPVGIGDVDEDGVPEIIAGKKKTYFQNGDIPTEQQRQQGASLLGGALPGGSVISAALRPGNPIGGLNIKGGKNPGGNFRTVTTNELGEFEFPDLTKGDYTFSFATNYVVTDEAEIVLNSNDTSVQRKGDVKLTASQNSQSLKTTTPKQIQGATFGEKVNQGMNQTKVQDHNSSRSNKSGSVIAPNPDSTGNEATRTNFAILLQTLDEADEQLAKDQSVNKAGISTSRSNIRNARATVQSIQNDLANNNWQSAQEKMATLNTQMSLLLQTLKNLGANYTTVSNVLKTKHDTAKNSVSNIR
ncbi:MAG: carboxypeptidase-like regulatory domain-containing protein [Lacibacter sp.]